MNSEYEKMIGQNIRTFRKKLNMTQDELAAKFQVRGCDLTRSALAKIEVGQRHIYPDEINLFHDFLNISYEELLPQLPK